MIAVELRKRTSPTSEALALRDALGAAAKTLGEKGAWPEAGVQIWILNDGDWDGARGKATATRGMGVEHDTGFVATLARAFAPRGQIICSAELFSTGLAKELLDDGATRDEIAAQFLAHESHHLSEPERRSETKAPRGAKSRYVSGIVPGLPQEWIAAAFEAAKRGTTDLALREGADIADEGAADAVGLFWMERAGLDWRTYARRLAALRKAGASRPGAYLTGDAIEALAAQGPSETLEDVYERCWELARGAASKCSDSALAATFAQLPSARVRPGLGLRSPKRPAP